MRKGWILKGASATIGPKGGNSAGCGVTVAKGHHPLSAMSGKTFDVSPESCSGRLVAAVLGARRRDAILVLEAYFWTGEGPMSRRNVLMLEAIAMLIAQSGLPFIIAGEF